MDADNPFDLERLAITPEVTASLGRAATAKRHHRQFVMVPWSWVERLQAAHYIGSYRVAMHLLFQHWKSDGQPVKLSNVALARMGVSRDQKWRALRELERLGLIGIERRKRRSPLVTILVL